MFDYNQLGALLAVEENGTYEGAARELNVSGFAVKQRIKTLETKLGVKLLETSPTRASKIGRILCDHTREVRALEEKVIEEHRQDCLNGNFDRVIQALPIAVCDEIFAEWFVDTLDRSPALDIAPAPRTQIVELMRCGEVIAALSHHTQEIHGFKSYLLGKLTYRAVANPQYVERHFPDGISAAALSKAPCYRFCGVDDLALDWTENVIGKPTRLRIIRYPSADGSLKACLEGSVCALHPDYRVQDALASGSLKELTPGTDIQRPLFWHVTGTMVDTLKPITMSIRGIAKSLL